MVLEKKRYQLIIFIIAAFALNSCSAIRYGRATTVTIETEHPGDTVQILAFGPIDAVDIQNVTLPYKYKVRHNNLPQRVDIVSKRYIYDPLTIGAERKGKTIGRIFRPLGWSLFGGISGSLGVIGFEWGSAALGFAWTGIGAAVAAPLLVVGYTSETDIPDRKFYHAGSVPADTVGLDRPGMCDYRQRALDDIDTLLRQGDYRIAETKASFLLETAPTAELFYLRGVSLYYSGEYNKALKDFNEALLRLDAETQPELKAKVVERISAIK